MHIAKIQKLENKAILVFYDIDLNILEEESFNDISSLNFFLQTLPRKYDVERTLFVVHDERQNKLNLQTAISENSYYVS
ncbi:MAG: hypothetical protein WB815_06590 [Nitrososphaeraceae archaeon]|jgi:hypothetical protein